MNKIKELISLFKKHSRGYSSYFSERIDENNVWWKIFVTGTLNDGVFESFHICLFYKMEDV